MGTTWLREFTGGLDARRLPETSAGGTLVRGRDGHINRGGEFEQRADFVQYWEAPANRCVGLAATGDSLVVFGHLGTAPPGLPSGVIYQQLAHPTGEALEDVPYTTLYRGKVAAVGRFANGDVFFYYDGTRITDANAPPIVSGSGDPSVLITAEDKLFVAAADTLFFSAITDPTDFGAGAGTGEGFVVMSAHNEASTTLAGLAVYDEYLAVFSRRSVQVWFFEADPANSRRNQTLANTGTVSPRSVTAFGDGDVFYLDRNGVRSLRARDSSNSARTADIGSAIDALVTEQLAGMTAAEQEQAIGIIEPRDGRYWLALGDRIYVFSYFPESQVSAWTEYRTGFEIEHMIVHDDRVWLRSGDTIYVYGGTGAFSYSDSVQAEAWTPYLDADDPSQTKILNGVDAAVRGEWEIRIATEPTDANASDVFGRIYETSYNRLRVNGYGSGTHFQVRFKCTGPASATAPGVLSSAVVHHDFDAEQDR